MKKSLFLLVSFFLLSCSFGIAEQAKEPLVERIDSRETLPDTEYLDWTDSDYGNRMMDGVQRKLDKLIAATPELRDAKWRHGSKTTDAYLTYLQEKRKSLAYLLGIREARKAPSVPRTRGTLDVSPVMAENDKYKKMRIEWDVFDDYAARGILIEPKTDRIETVVVVIPHNGMCPNACSQALPDLLKRADDGKTRIVFPTFLNREVVKFRGMNMPRREMIYRSAFMLGRHLIGYEIETVRAVVDWVKTDARCAGARIVVGGYGDGGMIALYTGALDPRIDEVRVAGYFGDRSNLWQEPLDRNVYGLLDEFGDAELAAMVFPRALVVEPGDGPNEKIVPDTFTQRRRCVVDNKMVEQSFPACCWAPGVLRPQSAQAVDAELARARQIVDGLDGVKPAKGETSIMTPVPGPKTFDYYANPLYQAGQTYVLESLDRHTQAIMRRSAAVRAGFMKKLDTSSLAALVESQKWYRSFFYDRIAGNFGDKPLPFHPRSKKVFDKPTWVGYDVVLDVADDLFVWGTLYIPKDVQPKEKRSVVVLQHGREGCPDSGINPIRAYNAVVALLLARGYIVFCPQNLYFQGDRYRVLQRKCYVVGKTFYGLMIAQHRQITSWLRTLPNVRPDKIGFYGISYGGKSAMFIPSVVTDYALSICSADFNERIVKCVDTNEPFSFMNTPEYEMYEFDSGDTFNYAELAMLIAPRPFMVERGHRDGVGQDEYVAFEYAKVRRFYDLLPETMGKTHIEFFNGVHEFHNGEALEFLDRHLK